MNKYFIFAIVLFLIVIIGIIIFIIKESFSNTCNGTCCGSQCTTSKTCRSQCPYCTNNICSKNPISPTGISPTGTPISPTGISPTGTPISPTGISPTGTPISPTGPICGDTCNGPSDCTGDPKCNLCVNGKCASSLPYPTFSCDTNPGPGCNNDAGCGSTCPYCWPYIAGNPKSNKCNSTYYVGPKGCNDSCRDSSECKDVLCGVCDPDTKICIKKPKPKAKCNEPCNFGTDCDNASGCTDCSGGSCTKPKPPAATCEGNTKPGGNITSMQTCTKRFPNTRSDKGGGMAGWINVQEDDGPVGYYLAASYGASGNDIGVQLSSDNKTMRFLGGTYSDGGNASGGCRVYLTTICPNGTNEGGCNYSSMNVPTCGHSQIAEEGGHKQFCLLGKTLQFDARVTSAGCCTNLALYFVSMPGVWKDTKGNLIPYDGPIGDYYCDGNAWTSICSAASQPNPPKGGITGGNADYLLCPELDIFEGNVGGIHVTPHACYEGPQTDSSKYLNLGKYGSAGMYMKGDEFTVNSWLEESSGVPYSVTIKPDISTTYGECDPGYSHSLCDGDGLPLGNAGTGILTKPTYDYDNYLGDVWGPGKKIDTNDWITYTVKFSQGTDNGFPTLVQDVTLSQGTNSVNKSFVYPNKDPFTGKKTNLGNNMVEILSKGMVMVMSYWADGKNTTAWLDGGQKGKCTQYSKGDKCMSNTTEFFDNVQKCSGSCPYNQSDNCTNPYCPILGSCPEVTDANGCGQWGYLSVYNDDSAGFRNISITTTK